MFAFSRTICSKAAAPASAAGTLPLKTLPRSSRSTDSSPPAVDNGSDLQKVPMVGITPGADTCFTLVPSHGSSMDLKPLTDYVAYDQTQQPESTVDAEIIYVGYGIEAPEYNWDDYKGVDVKGKVLLMLVN